MRDLTTSELGFVYGAGSCGKPCSPPPSCGGHGTGSKGRGTGSKGHGSKRCGSKSKGSKSKSKGSKCR